MSGERASTTRLREMGKICAICGIRLPDPQYPGERRSIACGGKHRVYLTFFLRDGWYCQFLEEDCKTSLPRKLNFKDPQKVVELIRRTGALRNLETRQAIDHAIENGRGGAWLELTDEQYQKLKTKR